jgi:DNA polymerase alpha subunit A
VVEKIHEYLTELGQSVKDGKKELDDFIIHKKLGKDPKDYPDVKSQPHVQVALRMKLKGNVTPKAGDVIPYIFCLGEDGSSSTRSAQADKARHPDELRLANTPWKIGASIQFFHVCFQHTCADIELHGVARLRLLLIAASFTPD